VKAADALDRVLKGEAVEASKPVRELAELAALLQGAWQAGPTPASTGRVRTAALAAFQETAAAPAVPSIVRSRPSGGRRLVARMALVAALVAGLPTAAWAASEEALPGEMLYPIKRGFEEVRLVLAGDAANEAQVLLGMAEERFGEAVRARALGLGATVDQALAGYDDALLRFQVRIVQAQAEGLPVAGLLAEAADLTEAHDDLFETAPAPAAVLPEVAPPSAEASDEGKSEGGSKAQGKGVGGKDKGNGKGNGNGGSRGSSGGNQGSGGGGGSDSSGGGSGGGNTGGNTGGGGNGGGGGVGDGKEEEPPAPEPDDDEGDDDQGSGSGSGSGHGSGEGEGLGHEIGRGEGHDKHGDDED
jgi:uncharacterized membrane protein YgcG